MVQGAASSNLPHEAVHSRRHTEKHVRLCSMRHKSSKASPDDHTVRFCSNGNDGTNPSRQHETRTRTRKGKNNTRFAKSNKHIAVRTSISLVQVRANVVSNARKHFRRQELIKIQVERLLRDLGDLLHHDVRDVLSIDLHIFFSASRHISNPPREACKQRLSIPKGSKERKARKKKHSNTQRAVAIPKQKQKQEKNKPPPTEKDARLEFAETKPKPKPKPGLTLTSNPAATDGSNRWHRVDRGRTEGVESRVN